MAVPWHGTERRQDQGRASLCRCPSMYTKPLDPRCKPENQKTKVLESQRPTQGSKVTATGILRSGWGRESIRAFQLLTTGTKKRWNHGQAQKKSRRSREVVHHSMRRKTPWPLSCCSAVSWFREGAEPRRTSTASSGSKCSPPDLNHKEPPRYTR